MFTVSVETRFQASHRLRLPDGSREALHSHNWSITADVSSEKLGNMGVVIDFHRLKGLVDGIVTEFEGMSLETVPYFQHNNSSAENVARYIYEKLELGLPEGTKLVSVEAMEEPGCAAKFSKQQY